MRVQLDAVPDAPADLRDPDTYAGDVDQLWRALLEPGVLRNPGPERSSFWILARHADVARLYRDDVAFSSAQGNVLGPPGVLDPGAGRTVTMSDGALHCALREVIAPALSQAVVAELEPQLRRAARQAVDGAVQRDHCDVFADIIDPLTIEILAVTMGVHKHDATAITDILRATRSLRPGSRTPLVQLLARAARLADAADDAPAGAVRRLATLSAAGCRRSRADQILNLATLFIAASETARQASAGVFMAIAQHPECWRDLRVDRRVPRSAVEEILRWTSPGLHVVRVATRDVRFGTYLIRASETVTAWNPPANRDPRVFKDPFRLDFNRRPNPHVTFGGGPHACLGASVARMQVRVLLEVLAASVRGVEIVAGPQRLRSTLVNGLAALTVRLVPA